MTTREAFRKIFASARAAESLHSWNDTTPDQTILAFLRAPAEASTWAPQEGNLDNVAEGYSPNSTS